MIVKVDCGVIEYGEAWDRQKEIFEALILGEVTDTLLLCEHPHVYTLGKSGKMDNMLADEQVLKDINATFYKTDRGGDITYHGYGQLVGYPLLNLIHYGISLKQYIYIIEQSIINTIASYGINGKRCAGKAGVWVDTDGREKKICAIGVRASRYITMHGYALNVNTDLKYFSYINPCGFHSADVTSMRELLGEGDVTMSSVKEIFCREFAALLEMEIK